MNSQSKHEISGNEDEKALEALKYLTGYCRRQCNICVLNKDRLCPSRLGERCPSMWQVQIKERWN